jgi:glucuronate isomerase
MFTSEPSLAQRIERMIGDTPIVDPHSHIRCNQPNVPDLATLIGYHRIRTELIAVGMPPEDLDPALPADERVRRSIPYLRRTRNTALSWCLFRIFRDLYDFGDSQLTESNYRDLFDKVAASGQDPDWAGRVLRDRSNIRTVVTSLSDRGADPSKEPVDFYYRLDAHGLFCPGVSTHLEPFFTRQATRGENLNTLIAVLGESPATTERLERLVFEWLDRTVTGRVRFTSTFLPIEHRLHPPDETGAMAALNHSASGGEPSDIEVETLAGFVSWSILKWHHEHRKPLQIAVGAECVLPGGEGIPRFQESWAKEMARGFRHFSGARFDLMVASDVLAHDVAVLAGQFPNVYASGDWWHGFFPAIIERNVGLRVQAAPATKVGGFFSDAEYVEWSYGKLQVVRKAMAAALARMVEARFLEEDEVPPLLRQILHDTPRDLYDLVEP